MMSAVSFLMMLLIMIIIPTILYTFFFLINCPPTPIAFFRRSVNSGETSIGSSKMDDHIHDDKSNSKNNMELVIMSLILGKDIECPICLSIFLDGEELRQIKICKHLFHKGCIDKWLSTHFNCPVCRAFVSSYYKTKEKEIGVLGSRNIDRSDLWQGLPDSAGLV